MENQRKGYLFIFLTSVFFGINTIGIRYYYTIFQNELPENVAFWGMGGAFLLIHPYFLFLSAPRGRIITSIKRDGKIITILAILSTLGAYLWLSGLKLLGAGPVSLLAKSQILFSAFFGILLLKERLTAFEITGIAIALPGIYFISALPGETKLAHSSVILFSALIYSFQSMLVKRFAKNLHGAEFTFLRAGLMTIFFGIIFHTQGSLTIPPVSQILFLGFVSVSGLMLGRSFYYEAHKYLDISRLGIGMLFEPVFVLFLSFFILAEQFTSEKIYGAVLILTGLWMTSLRNIRLQYIPDILKKYIFR